MSKDTRNSIIFIIVCIIIVLVIIIPIAINHNKENKKLEDSFSTIGQASSDFMTGIDKADSYTNDFSYNYETGEVEYHPTITLEMYNRIEEGMTKQNVIDNLGKEDNIIENEESNSYIIEYGESYLTKGYWVQIIIDKETNKVLKKYQVGLK